ncbi:MAG TPA: hypothetical protein VFB41_05335 [Solirubrobacteraceae bacterium]|nr:hypothetical protein [Solirubrobacteraceae bacterium]
MIVRIASEGQFDVADELAEELNALDNRCVEAVDAGDEPAFHAAYDGMLRFVRDNGTQLGDDELVGSSLILPPSDLSFAEAGEQFNGDGLIPD